MANQYDTNLKLQAIADAIGDSQSSGLISALEDIADAVAGGGGGGSAAAGLVSDNFSDTRTYSVGDYCIHNNTLYKCIRDISTAGPWDLSDWVSTNTGVELSSLNSAIANIPILKSSDYDTGSVQITRDSSTDMYYGTVNIEAPADASYAVGVCWVNTSWNACVIGVVSNTYISDNKKMFMVWFASSKSMTIPNRRIRIWYI